MTVIEEKPVPLYWRECGECGSTFTYKKAEANDGHLLTCPVCGVQLWATFEKVRVIDEEKTE